MEAPYCKLQMPQTLLLTHNKLTQQALCKPSSCLALPLWHCHSGVRSFQHKARRQTHKKVRRHPYAGLKASGVMGIWWQATSLIIAVVPVWLTQLGARLPASTTYHVLLAGLVASRFGLWLFDLSVSQMLQEWVPAEDVGELTDAHCIGRSP